MQNCEVLFQIEKDLGIEELTETERKVLAVLANLSGGTENDASLDDIRQDAIVTDVPAPSLYRAFSTLQSVDTLAVQVANGLGLSFA